MTALDHLRKLLGNGAEPVTVDSTPDGEYICFFCEGTFRYFMNPDRFEMFHTPDCPWLAAKAFVDQWDETDRLNAAAYHEKPL